MPVGHVLVRDAGGDVEHDDTALSLDVVPITETTKLLLARSIPDVEADRAEVGGEGERVYFNTEGGCIKWRNQSFCTTIAGSDATIHAPMYFFSNSPVK